MSVAGVEEGPAVPVAPSLPCSIAGNPQLKVMMRALLPLPTADHHMMDTGFAFSQGKEVARQLTMKCLPEVLYEAAEEAVEETEVAGKTVRGM